MLRRGFHVIAVFGLLAAAPAVAVAGDDAPSIPDLKVEKYTLPNGLEVILHEDHTTPIVGVNIWYKVGSKDEKPGRTGFAHLFEHLMFNGSKHHDTEYFSELEPLGAQINGSTNTDRTNYFETVPSNGLELALWLEADRMGFLLPALTQDKLDNQRDVVKNERRQRVDNVPYGQASEIMDRALYPPSHPYHHSVIGSMADLSAASLSDVSGFFRSYYAPSNASLCLAGDFDPALAKRLITKYFGPLPKGPEVVRPAASTPVLSGPKHITITDRVKDARTSLTWIGVPIGHEDEAALGVLGAVLGGLSGENRLYKALMYARPLASMASARNDSSALAGTFDVTISAQKGQPLNELVKMADAEIERLKTEGPSDVEVKKAQIAAGSRLVFSLQSATRKSDFLNQNNVELGDPTAYKDRLRRTYAVTPADVKRVAAKYLTADRVRLDVNSGAPTPRPAEPPVDRAAQAPLASPPAVVVSDDFDRSVMPKPGATPSFDPPAVVRRKLSNGLEVLIAERHGLPIIAMNLVIKGGETQTPAGKEGLAALTASLLTQGTATRDALGLAGASNEIGATLNASSDLESMSLTMSVLSGNATKAIELFNDVILNPSFPEKELERLRVERLGALRRQADAAQSISRVVFPRLLYGQGHPYGRPEEGTPKSVQDVTRDDIVAFHKRLFVPNNAALIIAGDTTPDAIIPVLEAALKGWAPGEPVSLALPEHPKGKPLAIYLVDKPEAAQSDITVGEVGVPRKSPDYFAISVLNGLLGGSFTSRINMNLRENKGYTYGARTAFAFRQGPGPFSASAPVKTEVTKESVIELVRELNEIRGSRGATEEEVRAAKDRLIKAFPARFESIGGGGGGPRGGGAGGLTATLAELVLYGLPEDYFTHYRSKVAAITRADVDRAARTYLNPDHMAILIVGDRAVVEPSLKSLPYAQVINILTPEGDPLPSPSPTRSEVK
jgi:zinc protease